MNEIDRNLLFCPITKQIFKDPVIAADGFAYEKEAIVEWFKSNSTSPLKQGEIVKEFVPALVIQNYVKAFLELHPEEKCNQYETSHQNETHAVEVPEITSSYDFSNERTNNASNFGCCEAILLLTYIFAMISTGMFLALSIGSVAMGEPNRVYILLAGLLAVISYVLWMILEPRRRSREHGERRRLFDV